MQSDSWTRVSVHRTHLELRSLDELLPSPPPPQPVELVRRTDLTAAEYLELYARVGDEWLWRDRLAWTDAELDAYLASPDVQVWTPVVDGVSAGYFELKRCGDRSVELVYFGLAPEFIGRRIGGWLLTCAAREAFALGATRLVLNTCTLDSPYALPNYLARGFRIVSEDRYLLDVPVRVKEQSLPTPTRHFVSRS